MNKTLIASFVILGIVGVIGLLLAYRHKLKNKQKLPPGCEAVKVSAGIKNRSPVDVFLDRPRFPDLKDDLRPENASEDYYFRKVLEGKPPVSKNDEVITLEEMRETFSWLHYPYDGQCACRSIKLRSGEVLKDVTVRCARCGQPFQFQHPL